MSALAPAPVRPTVRRGRGRRFRAGVALVGVLALGGVGASALWGDSAQVETTIFSGSVDITVDGNEGNPVPYAIDFPGAGNLVPGTRLTREVQVRNTGSEKVLVYVTRVSASGGSRGFASQLLGEIITPPSYAYEGRTSTAERTGGLLTRSSWGKTILPGQTMPMTLVIEAPTTMANTGQGKTDKVTYTLTANQAPK